MKRVLLGMLLLRSVLPAVPASAGRPSSEPLPYSDYQKFDCSGVPGSVPGKVVSYSARMRFGSKTKKIQLPVRHDVYVKISYCGKIFSSPALKFNLP